MADTPKKRISKIEQLPNTANVRSPEEKVPLLLTSYLFALMILYAVSITMIGPMMPHIIGDYQINLSQGGLTMTAQSIGGILAILFGGFIADRFRKTRLIWWSYLIFGLSLLLAGLVNIYSLLLLTLFVFGTGSRMADTILNAYVSDLYQKRRDFYLNLLHTFFGIGAFFGPVYARYIIDSNLSWKLVFSILGAAGILLILLMPLILKTTEKRTCINRKQDSLSVSGAPNFDGLLLILRSPVIWLICLIMIFYLGHQSVLSTWVPMYIESYLVASPAVSSLAISVLWLGIILGRAASAHLAGKVSAFRFLSGGSLAGAIIMSCGFLLQQPIVLVIALGFTGLFTGATIPLLVVIGCNRYPEQSGMVSALIFFSGSLSTMVFPWLAGRLADIFSFQLAMALSWLTLFLILAAAVPLRKIYNRNSQT